MISFRLNDFGMRNMIRALGACLLILTVCVAGLRGAGSEVADAVMNRDHGALQLLLKKKTDVNAPQRDGATALLGPSTTTTPRPPISCCVPAPSRTW